jgi:nitrous oxidase accessory protein
VVTILSSHVTLEGLTITHSGHQVITLDAAIAMNRVHHIMIKNCTLQESLYGIDMKEVSQSTIVHNAIRLLKQAIPYRGDAIKLWYGRMNVIAHNTIEQARDLSLVFSNDTVLTDNTISQCRYGIRMEHCHRTQITGNTLRSNAAGIMAMASSETHISHNTILHSVRPAGIAILIAGDAPTTITDNTLRYNAKAFYIDSSAKSTGIKRVIAHNSIDHNTEAFHFHLTIRNNRITHNTIRDNIHDVVKDVRGYPTRDNVITENFWDRYEGFDRNHDGFGDTPYMIYAYADQLWQHDHHIQFFFATPMMSLLDLLSRIAPFTEPEFLLKDTQPRM